MLSTAFQRFQLLPKPCGFVPNATNESLKQANIMEHPDIVQKLEKFRVQLSDSSPNVLKALESIEYVDFPDSDLKVLELDGAGLIFRLQSFYDDIFEAVADLKKSLTMENPEEENIDSGCTSKSISSFSLLIFNIF